jgi:hypothetical protein
MSDDEAPSRGTTLRIGVPLVAGLLLVGALACCLFPVGLAWRWYWNPPDELFAPEWDGPDVPAQRQPADPDGIHRRLDPAEDLHRHAPRYPSSKNRK